jgi:hypothetical protein
VPAGRARQEESLRGHSIFTGRQWTAGSRINGFFIRIMRGLQSTLHILPGTSARIKVVALVKTMESVEVKRAPFALSVGREWTSNVRTLVPGESEPAEIPLRGEGEFRLATFMIEIFVAQD